MEKITKPKLRKMMTDHGLVFDKITMCKAGRYDGHYLLAMDIEPGVEFDRDLFVVAVKHALDKELSKIPALPEYVVAGSYFVSNGVYEDVEAHKRVEIAVKIDTWEKPKFTEIRDLDDIRAGDICVIKSFNDISAGNTDTTTMCELRNFPWVIFRDDWTELEGQTLHITEATKLFGGDRIFATDENAQPISPARIEETMEDGSSFWWCKQMLERVV